MLEDTNVTTPKEVRCHSCNKTGHIHLKCPDNPRAVRMANAISHSGVKACVHCKEADGHTFRDKSNTASSTKRLYCCPKFMQLATAMAKAKVIQDLAGCFLCTDTSHKTDDCKSPYLCKVKVDGVKCGRKHSHWLHGARGFAQCNLIVAKATTREQNVLLEFIMTSFKASFGITQGLVFFDNGATLAIIRDKFAELLQLKGEKVTEWIKVLGQAWEIWNTILYNVPMIDKEGTVHTVQAYGMA